jgi:hypothetical protein
MTHAKWFINVGGMNIWTFSQYWLSTLDLAHRGGTSSKSHDTCQGIEELEVTSHRSAVFLSEGAWRIDHRGIDNVYWTPYGRTNNIDHFRRLVVFSVHQARSTNSHTLVRECWSSMDMSRDPSVTLLGYFHDDIHVVLLHFADRVVGVATRTC